MLGLARTDLAVKGGKRQLHELDPSLKDVWPSFDQELGREETRSQQTGPPRVLSGVETGNKYETVPRKRDGGSTKLTIAFQTILGDKYI